MGIKSRVKRVKGPSKEKKHTMHSHRTQGGLSEGKGVEGGSRRAREDKW